MKKTVLAAVTSCIALLSALPAAAETPHAGYRETGHSEDWVGIYSPDRGVEKTTSSCAIYARPKASSVFDGDQATDIMRGELAAFIGWDGEEITSRTGVVSFMLGTDVVEGRDAIHSLSIDGKTQFAMMGTKDRLYIMEEDDGAAIAAMRAGTEMVVTAHTQDDKIVKDTYSLMGVVAMTKKQKSACN